MPETAHSKTFTVDLDIGTHWLCTCGDSENFPYCNGTHQGSPFKPLALTLDTPKVITITQPKPNSDDAL